MDVEGPPLPTTDEQLGSPGWTLEQGVLAGLVLGMVVLAVRGRRRSRRRAHGGPSS